jgi:hypothetical protein
VVSASDDRGHTVQKAFESQERHWETTGRHDELKIEFLFTPPSQLHAFPWPISTNVGAIAQIHRFVTREISEPRVWHINHDAWRGEERAWNMWEGAGLPTSVRGSNSSPKVLA